MQRIEFEMLVERALMSVPDWFRERLENIEIMVENEPPGKLMREMELGRRETLLGLYQGVPLSQRGFYYGNVLPDRIVLYMGPILRLGGSEEELEARVREVVIHEIGHYFGLSDEELRALEGGSSGQ